MAEARALAHRNDPDTSHEAVPASAAREQVKNAILYILGHLGEYPTRGGLAVFEVTESYFEDRAARGWPEIQPYSIARRMSELHNDKLIFDTGDRVPTPFGRTAVVWAVAHH